MRPDSWVERAAIILLVGMVGLGALIVADGRFNATWQAYQHLVNR